MNAHAATKACIASSSCCSKYSATRADLGWFERVYGLAMWLTPLLSYKAQQQLNKVDKIKVERERVEGG
jgi:hypothetical protein